MYKIISILILITLAFNFNVNSTSVEEDKESCKYAMCHGNFACPEPYLFYRHPGVCCYDCVLSCQNTTCPKLACSESGNYVIPAGGRFCCDHCYQHPYF